MSIQKFDIQGMSCAACSARVEKAVSSLNGVNNCSVSLLTNEMSVDSNLPTDIIIDAVKKAGYGATIQQNRVETKTKDVETRTIIIRLLVSFICLITLIAFMKLGEKWPQVILAMVVMIVNRTFFISGIKSAVHLSPNMDTLVALGSLAAFVYGYYESSAMILTLITVGKTLESYAKGKTTNALKELAKIAPKTAIIINDDKETEIPIEKVKIGDNFVVYAGLSIPVDGIVSDGNAIIDESMLTGESAGIDKSSGDKVSAATICKKGKLICQATAIGQDTTFSQIIKLVSDAATSKAPIAKMADKVSAVFVPTVIFIAIVVTVLWVLLGKELSFAIARGISVLVISCPCSLGLATPVAIMVASGIGAKNGILFKTAAAIEQTGRINTVVLDKTGTLTYSNREITDLESLESSSIKAQEMANTLREGTKESIDELKKLGVEVHMITGDRKQRATEIAQKCGIDKYICEGKPEDKIKTVIDLQQENKKVAMIGDGINDGPALTQADVGIAIGAGTDVAIDAADIVLVKSNLRDAVAAIKLGRKTLLNIKENLFWAFFYNIIGIPIAAGAFGLELSPSIGAACMSLSSFCVVTNALRLNFVKLYDKPIERGDVSMTEIIIKVDGMMCPHCEAHVKDAIEKIAGVKQCVANHKEKVVKVSCEKEVDINLIKEAIVDAGYTVVK